MRFDSDRQEGYEEMIEDAESDLKLGGRYRQNRDPSSGKHSDEVGLGQHLGCILPRSLPASEL